MRSTGKRRYGHPALTGVLPQPWLPLKKGQTLVNRDPSAPRPNRSKSSNEAVVLTLRKRYSSLRRSRTVSQSYAGRGRSSGRDEGEDGTTRGYSDADSTINNNPWSDSPAPRRTQSTANGKRVNPRLSFDGASGVIMLPEDANWLMEETNSDIDSEDESDLNTAGGRTPTTEGGEQPEVGAGDAGSSSVAERAGPSGSGSTEVLSTSASAPAASSTPSKRHGTYFHHPERTRKRSSVGGVFTTPRQ